MNYWQTINFIAILATITFVQGHCVDCSQQRRTKRNTQSNNDFSIPLDFIHELNAISNVTEFYNFIDESSLEQVHLNQRYQNDGDIIEKSRDEKPIPAHCMPELKVVSLQPPNSSDPTMIYYPSCTRVKQCGGCCSHKLLECQPIETQNRLFTVTQTQFTGSRKIKFIGNILVVIEEHLSCKCDCKITSKDCNEFQVFSKPECKCNCINSDDQNKCLQENDTKIWDSMNCLCKCRDSARECTTGTYFDNSKCACIEIPQDRTTAAANNPRLYTDRKRFILKPTYVPLSDDVKYNLNKKK